MAEILAIAALIRVVAGRFVVPLMLVFLLFVAAIFVAILATFLRSRDLVACACGMSDKALSRLDECSLLAINQVKAVVAADVRKRRAQARSEEVKAKNLPTPAAQAKAKGPHDPVPPLTIHVRVPRAMVIDDEHLARLVAGAIVRFNAVRRNVGLPEIRPDDIGKAVRIVRVTHCQVSEPAVDFLTEIVL